MRTIKYVGFYTKDKNKFNRNGSIAATNKMGYICSALNNAGYKVNIISPSWFSDNRTGYSKQYTNVESEVKSVTFAPSFNASNRLSRRLRAIYAYVWLFIFLLWNTKSGEDIIVYHSLSLIRPVMLAKAIKKFNIILETNEIYCDVKKYPNRIQKLEKKMFLSANKYIFSTELLNQKLNKDDKPFSINYGTYKVEEDRKFKFNDKKVHVVYAGTFDPRKGGGVAAAAAAEYLPKNYHVHIIGFGSNEDTKLVLDKIEQVAKESDATVTYDGLLKGEEYINFLQKCDIGLSTQIPDGTYNETSFPSKILSYMANGLRVVSVRIKAIEMSVIGDEIFYYEVQTPKAIAEAIIEIDINKPYDSIELIKKMDREFTHDIKELLEK